MSYFIIRKVNLRKVNWLAHVSHLDGHKLKLECIFSVSRSSYLPLCWIYCGGSTIFFLAFPVTATVTEMRHFMKTPLANRNKCKCHK